MPPDDVNNTIKVCSVKRRGGLLLSYEFELKNLITRNEDIEKVKQGLKTAVRRSNRFGDVGDEWQLAGKTLRLENVYQQKLAEVTDEHAKQEGYENLEAYKRAIYDIHEEAVWHPDMKVWVHEFKIV